MRKTYLNTKMTKLLAILLIHVLLVPDQGVLSDMLHNHSANSVAQMNLAVWTAAQRDVARQMHEDMYRDLFDNNLAPQYGGKGAWDIVAQKLADKIGYSVPGSIRFTIQEIWQKFVEANKDLIDQGNSLIPEFTDKPEKLSEDKLFELFGIIRQLSFPKELDLFIREHTEELKGNVIIRSSGRREDSFLMNLAGIFISPRKEDERMVVNGVKEIFVDAIYKMWIWQNDAVLKIKELPNRVTAEEGFGVVIQPFIEFDASGSAMSNYYGHTTIEAVIGDAEMAVRSIYANATQFLFEKGKTTDPEVNPTYVDLPHQFRLRGDTYRVDENPDAMRDVMKNFPKVKGHFSPINMEQAKELNRVTNELEKEIGVPLDIEWGFVGKKLYIIQIRPIIGNFKKPLVNIDKELKKKSQIARSPITIGETKPEGFTGRVVAFSNNVDRDTIKKFEKDEEFFKAVKQDKYIRLQNDVASSVLETGTRAQVLVDVIQGSRQAHNINLITKRISKGEFQYCNGPVIKKGLLEHLHFVPHPTLEGVWISDEDVTYFSDGLRGEFFQAKEHTIISAVPVTPETRFDRIFRLFYSLQEKLEQKIEDTDIKTGAEAFLLELGIPQEIIDYNKDDIHNAQEMEEFIGRLLKAGESHGKGIEDFVESTEILKAVVGFPLWPEKWETEFLKLLRGNPIYFLDDYHYYQEELEQNGKEEAVEISEPVFPDKIRILYANDSMVRTKLVMGALTNEFGLREKTEGHHVSNEYEVFYVKNESEAIRVLEDDNININYVIMDWLMPSGINGDSSGSGPTFLLEALNKTDIRHIAIDSLNTENFKAGVQYFAEQHHRASVRHFPQDFPKIAQHVKQAQESIYKDYEKDLKLWEEQEQKKALFKPIFPDRLKILYVNDRPDEMAKRKQLFIERFGLREIDTDHYISDEYEIYFEVCQNHAVNVLQKPSLTIDYVIMDWKLPETKDGIAGNIPGKLLKEIKEQGIRIVDIDTVLEMYTKQAREYLKSIGYENAFVKPFPAFDEDIINRVESVRNEQLVAYEKGIYEWMRKQKTPVKPVYPERLKVLYVDDDVGKMVPVQMMFRDIGTREVEPNHYAGDEYEVFFASNQAEAAAILSNPEVSIDYMILDWVLPGPEGKGERPPKDLLEVVMKKGVRVIDVSSTVMPPYVEEAQEYFAKRKYRANIRDFPMRPDECIRRIKTLRAWQIQAYHMELEAWKEVIKTKVPEKPVLGKLRVLLIEDEENLSTLFADMFKRTLKGADFELVMAASSGEAGKKLTEAKENPFHVIFYDFRIPGLENIVDDLIAGDSRLILQTGAFKTQEHLSDDAMRQIQSKIGHVIGKKLCDRTEQNVGKPASFNRTIRPIIEKTRREQIERHDEAMVRYKEAMETLAVEPVYPEKLRVLVMDDDKDASGTSIVDSIVIGIISYLGTHDSEYEIVTISSADEISEKWKKDDEFDVIIYDLTLNFEDAVKKKIENSGAKIFLQTGMTNDESEIRREIVRRYGKQVNEQTQDLLIKPEVLEYFMPHLQRARAGQLEDYFYRKGVWDKLQEEKGDPEPPYPEKLKILLIEDDRYDEKTSVADFFAASFKSEFGSQLKEYELVTISSQEEIEEKWKPSAKFNIIIYDLALPFRDKIKDKLESSGAILIAQSGFSDNEDTAREQLKKRYSDKVNEMTVQYIPKPYDNELLFTLIRNKRKQQLQEYAKKKSDWDTRQKAKIPPKPKFPKKLRVLMIDDVTDVVGPFSLMFSKSLSTGPEGEYELITISSEEDIPEKWGDNVTFDLIIYDYNIPFGSQLRDKIKQSSAPMILESAAPENLSNLKVRIQRRFGLDAARRTYKLVSKPWNSEDLFKLIREKRKEQVVAYDKEIEQWKLEALLRLVPQVPPKLNVLVIDDGYAKGEYMFAEITMKQETEFNIMYTSTYDEAIEVFEREAENIDVVVFDLGIPDQSKHDILDAYLMDIPEMLVVTGLAHDLAMERVDERFAPGSITIDYLQKHFTDEFIDKLRGYRQKQLRKHEQTTLVAKSIAYYLKKKEGMGRFEILLVDDSLRYLKSLDDELSSILSRDDYCIFFTDDENDLKAYLTSDTWHFDAVVIDMNFVGGAYIFAPLLKDVPVIAVISRDDEKEIKQRLESNSYAEIGGRAHAIEKHDIGKPVEVAKRLASLLKQARRQRQIMHDEAVRTLEAGSPDKMRVLIIDDDEDGLAETWKRWCVESLSSNYYEFESVTSSEEALRELSRQDNKYNLILCDIKIPGFKDIKNAIKDIEHFIFVSDYFEDEAERNVGKEMWERSLFLKKPFMKEKLIGTVKKMRTKQVDKWMKDHPEALDEQAGIDKDKKTIFVIAQWSQEAKDLADTIRKQRGEKYNVIEMDSIWWLKRHLNQVTPDIVVTDIMIDGKDELEIIQQLVLRANPEAEFILTSDDASIRSKTTGKTDSVHSTKRRVNEVNLEHLRKVKAEGWDALSEYAKEVLLNPDEAVWGVNFRGDIYYELYTFLNPLEPTPWGIEFFNEHKERLGLGDKDAETEIRSLLELIALNALFHELSSENREIVRKYIKLPGESVEARIKKGDELERVLFSAVEREDKAAIEKFIEICYTAKHETIKWFSEWCGEQDFYEFGKGDENDFISTIGQEILGMYIPQRNYWWKREYHKLGVAKNCLVNGDIKGAIHYYRWMLLNSSSVRGEGPLGMSEPTEEYDTEDVDRLYPELIVGLLISTQTIVCLEQELRSLHNQGFDGLPEIIEALIRPEFKNIVPEESKEIAIKAVLEKPFHFGDVIDVLDGTHEDKTTVATETFRMEESARIADTIEKTHALDKQAAIMIWDEYIPDLNRESLYTRIQKDTREGPYKVVFRDLDRLVDIACEQAAKDNEDIVTILPYHMLDAEQIKRLTQARASIIYMDFEQDTALD